MLLQFPYFFCFHYVVITVKYLYSCNLQDPEGNRIKGGKYQGEKVPNLLSARSHLSDVVVTPGGHFCLTAESGWSLINAH